MEKKKNQNIIEKALMYATIAHSGAVRKGEPNKPYIMHPIAVAQILNEYGADENVIAAALLHDVVEDNQKYSLEDISKVFGEDIANLVCAATEKDKSKSWEERKAQKIETIKQLDFREKLIIIADKINNIGDINRIFERKGFRDFSAFSRGEKQQEWYYRNVYKSLIENEDSENPLFKKLEAGINKAFGRSMEEYEKTIDSDERQFTM